GGAQPPRSLRRARVASRIPLPAHPRCRRSRRRGGGGCSGSLGPARRPGDDQPRDPRLQLRVLPCWRAFAVSQLRHSGRAPARYSRPGDRGAGAECRRYSHVADVTLNHTTQKISQEVRALTDKRGADVVIDHVGEATWEESLRSLGRGGRFVSCGGTTGPKVAFDIRRLFWYQWSLMGSTMGN